MAMAHQFLNRSLILTLIAVIHRVVFGHRTSFAWVSIRVRRGENVIAPTIPMFQFVSGPRISPIGMAMQQSDASVQKYSDEQNEINSRIYSVASTICNLSSKQLNIDWKPDRIIVTVKVDQAYIDATDETDDIVSFESERFDAEDDFLDTEEIEDPMSMADEMDENGFEDVLAPHAESSVNEEIIRSNGVDLTLLARSINAALDDEGNIGSQIAERYEIEVTTPGISNELTTPVMFAAYRGFDVLLQYQDPKTKKIKAFEGRLVERNADFVVLNMKGRMKHFKNSDVLTVKLPKAKKEKGV